jgi:hypothetical protein
MIKVRSHCVILVVVIIFASLIPISVDADPEGPSIPVNSAHGLDVTNTENGTIQGSAQRQGAQTGHANTIITAGVAGEEIIATTQTAADGAFISPLQIPASGDYVINAHYDGYLQSQKNSVHVEGNAVDIGATQLVGGDVNSDNCINILDIVSIIIVFDTTSWPASEPNDINDDGTVNILDLTLAAGNFTRCGPTMWVY